MCHILPKRRGWVNSISKVHIDSPLGYDSFVWFYDISTIVGYLMPNLFLYIWTVLIQSIQFSISTQFSSIWPIHRTLSGATTPGQSGPGSDGNEGVLLISQSSSITGTSLSDCLVSYSRTLVWGGLILLQLKQLVYSTITANWATGIW